MCMIFVSQNHHRQTDFFCHDFNDFPSTRYYYLAMAEDIILRLLWVIGLILKQVGSAIIFSKNMNNHCYLKHMSLSFIFSNHFFSAQI